MKYFLIVLAVIAAIAAIGAVSAWRSGVRLRRQLRKEYGKAPRRKYDEYDLEHIAAYWELHRTREQPEDCVDDLTWRDLDMDRVFMRINGACSSVGEEVLYSTLHEQASGAQALNDLEDAAHFFDTHPEERLRAQYALSRLGRVDANGAADFIYNPGGKRVRFQFFYPLLTAAAAASLLSVAVLGARGFFVIVAVFIVNICVYFRTKYRLEAELVSVRYLSGLVVCAGKLSRIKNAELRPKTDRLSRLHAVLKSLGRVAGAVMTNTAASGDFLTEYVRIFFMLDFVMYGRMLSAIQRHAAECAELYRLVGFLDEAIAVASYRRSVAYYTTPEFTGNAAFAVRDLVHPLLSDPVANSVTLYRSSIITGSNASGKSTFVKALAVNAILGQTIHTCLASSFRLAPSFVVTSMAVSDSITAGESYYIAEIRSLRRILQGLNGHRRCLCFIDEILKGTNTVERIAASAAVLGYLKEQNCLAVIATHDIELTEMAQAAFDNFHFEEQVRDDGIEFDYRIRDGRATTKNAIRLLGFMDYPPSVVEKANELARDFEAGRVWGKIEP